MATQTPSSHKPVPVPSGKQPVRRAVAQSRNGVRRGRRIRTWASTKVREFGGQYKCIYCKNWIALRQQKSHDAACGWAARQDINQRGAAQQNGNQQQPDRPPQPRRPDPDKTRRRRTAQNSQQGDTTVARPDAQQNTPPNQNGQQPPQNGQSGGNGQGRVPVSSSAHAALKAMQAWCQEDVRTTADLKAHHMSMEAVFVEMANLLQGYAQEKLIARKFHPAVAQPIQLAADGIAGVAHYFTQSYVNFEHVYAGRLEYERSAIPKPDERDPIFTQVD